MRMNRKDFLKLVGQGTAASMAAASVGGATQTAAQAPAAPARQKKEVKGNAIKGTTDAVRRFIAASSLRDMPPNVVTEGKRCLIDNVGVLLAGSTAEGSHILRQYAQKSSGAKEATVLGREPVVVSAAHAALANAGSAHALDYDDTQLSTTPDRTFGLLTHPTTPALSAALAVAERSGASGAAFLEAYLVGVEVECKMAEAIDPNHYERGFHSTGTLGAFGAAAAAGKLMKLNEAQLAHMLAIAASLSAGIRVNFGSMSKPLNAARASENGVFAAEIAAHGFTGGDNGLDGQWGFFQVLGDGADLDRLIGKLGRPWSIVNPGVSFKPYPCGSLSHPSMDAMMKVVKDHDLKPDQIKAVRLRAGNNILDPLRYGVAKNELEAKFSVPFLMSAVILTRRAGMREFTDEFVQSPAAQQMMQRVTAVRDMEIEKQGFDKIRSVVEVDLVDGRKLVQPSDDRYRGGPDNPFTREDLKAKFDDCAGLVLAQDRLTPVFNAIESVDSMADIRQLVRMLAPRT
jgi:2-methylcitrate dehydratase PrpD